MLYYYILQIKSYKNQNLKAKNNFSMNKKNKFYINILNIK